MPIQKSSQDRPSSPSEYDPEDLKNFFSSICRTVSYPRGFQFGEEPKTPEIIQVEEPQSPPPILTLPPTTDVLTLPPIPRKKVVPKAPRPLVSKLDVKTKLKTIPDAASITIERTAKHRIKKTRPSKRPRMTKNPRSSPYHCKLCLVTCTGRVQYLEHLRSRKHQQKASKEKHFCATCKLEVTSKADLERHFNGRQHRQGVLRRK